jgi:integrase/recombinase XerC
MTTAVPTPQLQPHTPTCLTCQTSKNGKQQALSQNPVQITAVTHLIEDGADPKFVQAQVGHRFASTTAIYTGISGDFMNTMMRKVLDKTLSSEEPTR